MFKTTKFPLLLPILSCWHTRQHVHLFVIPSDRWEKSMSFCFCPKAKCHFLSSFLDIPCRFVVHNIEYTLHRLLTWRRETRGTISKRYYQILLEKFFYALSIRSFKDIEGSIRNRSRQWATVESFHRSNEIACLNWILSSDIVCVFTQFAYLELTRITCLAFCEFSCIPRAPQTVTLYGVLAIRMESYCSSLGP